MIPGVEEEEEEETAQSPSGGGGTAQTRSRAFLPPLRVFSEVPSITLQSKPKPSCSSSGSGEALTGFTHGTTRPVLLG